MNGKQLRRSAAVVLALPMVALAVLVAVPPWCARMPCIVQARIGGWTGIYFHHFPRDFTGTLRLWDERGRLLFEHPYRNGLREGTWFKYEEDGRKVTLELVREITKEELERIRGERGESRFQRGHFPQAMPLFDELVASNELEEFLTLKAYELLA